MSSLVCGFVVVIDPTIRAGHALRRTARLRLAEPAESSALPSTAIPPLCLDSVRAERLRLALGDAESALTRTLGTVFGTSESTRMCGVTTWPKPNFRKPSRKARAETRKSL